MSKLGKIFMDNTSPHACVHVIIAEEGAYLRGLKLVKSSPCNNSSFYKIENEEITKLKENDKLDDCGVVLDGSSCIRNLQIKEIGALTDEAYCRLLNNFVTYQTCMGARDPSYLVVRDEVHDQLIKMMEKGIYGVK